MNEKNIKSICPENQIDQILPISVSAIQYVVPEASESLIKKVNTGVRTGGRKTAKVVKAKKLLCDVMMFALNEVRDQMGHEDQSNEVTE